ncbi:MAG: class I SAM-dependent methyltransferase [Vicinamibacteria bacterium]
MLRWLDPLAATSELYGSDISEAAVTWCQRHLPFATFSTNGPLPPLLYPDDSFDLIFSISVLTHLDEDYQFQWLKELKRIAKPGAFIVQTVHGMNLAKLHLAPKDVARLDRKGFLYGRESSSGGLHGHPDFYQTAYHTNAYIEREWSRFFRIAAMMAHGPAYHQEMVLMENDEARGESPVCRELPMIVLDEPQIARVVESSEMMVRGWAFYPDGRDLRLDLWIDGNRVRSLDVADPRPDVAKAFPVFPTAGRSGFSGVVRVDDLSHGPHRIWLTRSGDDLPCVSSYFLKQ